jgi:hypothetical protein
VLIEQIAYVLHPGKAPALVAAYEQQGARGRSRQAVGRSAWRRFAQIYGHFLVRRRNQLVAGPLFTGPGKPR